ncbi:unnamed protein product [Didymodactylos carnosus]|nr:unnamed protein product [Didymodactylos carnosus]CAF4294050.1 unnamed protein product [Didymodactylos carnosus]
MAALPVVLGGMFCVGGKLLWNMIGKPSTPTPYDVIIRMNTLTALSTNSWEILLGENTKDVTPTMSRSENNRGVVVAALGSCNRGKSYLLNQLCNIQLPIVHPKKEWYMTVF